MLGGRHQKDNDAETAADNLEQLAAMGIGEESLTDRQSITW